MRLLLSFALVAVLAAGPTRAQSPAADRAARDRKMAAELEARPAELESALAKVREEVRVTRPRLALTRGGDFWILRVDELEHTQARECDPSPRGVPVGPAATQSCGAAAPSFQAERRLSDPQRGVRGVQPLRMHLLPEPFDATSGTLGGSHRLTPRVR